MYCKVSAYLYIPAVLWQDVRLAPLAKGQTECLVAQLPLELEPVLVPSSVFEEVVPKGRLPVPAPQTVAPNPLDQITDAGNQHVLFAP